MNGANIFQPTLFVSHGTIYEAIKNTQLQSDFNVIRKQFLANIPSSIVVFSGHWQTETISITSNEIMLPMDEGFPLELQPNFETVGNLGLSLTMLEMLKIHGIEAKLDKVRGLDHGALIPLLLLFPNEKIPVVQISQQYLLDPNFHKKLAEALMPLRNENVLFIGSGGLVHNRNALQKFAGQEVKPDLWAKDFDDLISNEMEKIDEISLAQRLINAYSHPLFLQSHPTSEHFLPLIFASAMGGKPRKIYDSFQWKNLSMGSFLFD